MKRLMLLLLFLMAACIPNELPPTGVIEPTEIAEPTPTQEILRQSQYRWGYNINGYAVPDRQYLLRHTRELNPTFMLVMDDLTLAGEMARQNPDTIIIYRGYSACEGSEWNCKTPQQFVDRWLADRNYLNTHGYSEQQNIIFYTTNEPSFGGNYSVEQFVAHLVETMRLARQNNITLAAGNFATGMVQPEWITSGKFDPYIRALDTYGHYHAAHEYTTAVLAFGVGQMTLECLLDQACVQPTNWAEPEQLPVAYWHVAQSQSTISGFRYFGDVVQDLPYFAQSIEMLPPYWHIRRNDWFLLRADTIGVKRPRIVLTECCHDFMGDIRIVLDVLKARYGLPLYHNDLRGINTHRGLWQWYFPQWTFAQALHNQIVWADSIYPPDYVGFLQFTWSRHEHWQQADHSGVENPDLYNYHQMQVDYARSIDRP